MMARAVLVGVLAMLSPAALHAQNSIYGTRGIGFPGRAASVRSLALGGGADMFDRGASLNPALAGTFRQVTVGVVSATTFRQFTVGGVDASGLRETRFPLAYLGGGIRRSNLSYQLSISTYAERTFDAQTTDTVMIGGVPMQVQDQVSADGGVVDLRAAFGYTVSAKFAFGAAYHRLAGSSRFSATRTFESVEFQPFQEDDALRYSGNGFSAGVLWLPNPTLGFAFSGRMNSSLGGELDDQSTVDVALPISLAGGGWIALGSQMHITTTARWRSWSRGQDDLASTGTRAFNTLEVGSGLEIGSLGEGGLRFPIRLGVRYAELPFSPNDDQPTEWNFAVGTGAPFAGNRAVIDLALQRFTREGAGASEQGWYFAVGITITPIQ
jgi:hypothetical protein